MAVSQRNTQWYKKGEKLPDGTTAKKGVLWNRKTAKRVTGKVRLVQDGANNRKAGEKVEYTGGRKVKSARKTTKLKQNRSGQTPSTTQTPSTQTPTTQTPAANKQNPYAALPKGAGSAKKPGLGGKNIKVNRPTGGRKANPAAATPKEAQAGAGLSRAAKDAAKRRAEERAKNSPGNSQRTTPEFVRDVYNRNRGKFVGDKRATATHKQTWDGKKWVNTHVKKKLFSGQTYWLKY